MTNGPTLTWANKVAMLDGVSGLFPIHPARDLRLVCDACGGELGTSRMELDVDRIDERGSSGNHRIVCDECSRELLIVMRAWWFSTQGTKESKP